MADPVTSEIREVDEGYCGVAAIYFSLELAEEIVLVTTCLGQFALTTSMRAPSFSMTSPLMTALTNHCQIKHVKEIARRVLANTEI